MVNLAIFHSTLPQYLRTTADDGDQKNMNIALAGDQFSVFIAEAGKIKIDALVVDLALLGDIPDQMLSELERALRPDLTLVVYSFAKWETIERLRAGQNRQMLRAPVSARSLRSNMLSLIVRNLTKAPSSPSPMSPPEAGLLRIEQPAPMRRFNDNLLAALQDIESAVECECPNQVADLVLALSAFETYSAQCQNKNEKDAGMHRLLARVTGHARAVMEYGLKELCAFENIDLAKLTQSKRRSA